MLYDLGAGVNAAPREAKVYDGGDLDHTIAPFRRDRRGMPLPDTVSLGGLAATIPHRANVTVVTPGGGGGQSIGPADTGGGGGGGSVPQGSESIAVTIPPSGRSSPAGRNTSPFTPGLRQAQRGVVRNKYQPSSQGSRISQGEKLSPITPQSGSGYPAGGLYGVDGGLAGMDGFFSNIVNRVTAPFKSVRQLRNSFGGQAVNITYRVAAPTVVGAATGFVASGFNPVGAVAGGAYGLSKGIYGVTSNAPLGRTTYQTLIPAAATGALVYGATAAFGGGLTPAQASLVGTGQGSTGLTAAGLPSTTGTSWIVNAPANVLSGQIATSAQIAGTTQAGTTGSLIASDFVDAPLVTPAGNAIALPPSGLSTTHFATAADIAGGSPAVAPSTSLYGSAGTLTGSGYSTPAQIAAATTSPASSGGILSATGTLTGDILKNTLPILALSALTPKQQAAQAGGGSGDFIPGGIVNPNQPPALSPYITGPGGISSGGDSGSAPTDAPSILAGYSPLTLLIVGGIAVTLMFPKLRGKK